ncbi:MAG: single-stranded DNA-binding protein [Oscillospiraceae bacterium]|nr:single-stranded DNA-binding protein [Oscillospiraceae bacterium]
MLNKVILMGRLTKDPELRHTQSDLPVASFTLAVDRGYSKGKQQQTTDFINIVAWRGTAEFVSKWFSKGQLVAVSGKLQVRNYKDRDGNNRTDVEVVADEAFFAESKQKRAEGTYDTGGNEFAEIEPVQGGFEIEPVQGGFAEIICDDGELPF